MGKHYLEANDSAGNTFKATAKPVLIGTAVVGATTMIFSIILVLGQGAGVAGELCLMLRPALSARLRLRVRGRLLVLGRVDAGRHDRGLPGRRVHQEEHGPPPRKRRTSMTRSPWSRICTKYAQAGMWNIFIALMTITLAFAFFNPNFFVAYLISIAVFGLFQAIYMANAGGSWDNAKKLVEVDLKEKGTPLHAATVIGDTVGDPFKDTTSVSLNPIIKFSTLFGLLAVEIAVKMDANGHGKPRRRTTAPTWASLMLADRAGTSCGGRSTRCGFRRTNPGERSCPKTTPRPKWGRLIEVADPASARTAPGCASRVGVSGPSFPSSAWERTSAKLRSASRSSTGLEAELRGWRSQAELGNEGREGEGAQSLLPTSVGEPSAVDSFSQFRNSSPNGRVQGAMTPNGVRKPTDNP